MAFKVHKTRRVWPEGVYKVPDEPHHIHFAPCPADCEEDHEHVPVCTDHRVESCPAAHWLGGHPDPNHLHHVEYDGATGRWGYTRLSREEIADLKQLEAFELERQEKEEARIRARIDAIRERAKDDPTFLALAEHLGIPLEA